MSERDVDKRSGQSGLPRIQAELPTQGTALNPMETDWFSDSMTSAHAQGGLSLDTEELD